MVGSDAVILCCYYFILMAAVGADKTLHNAVWNRMVKKGKVDNDGLDYQLTPIQQEHYLRQLSGVEPARTIRVGEENIGLRAEAIPDSARLQQMGSPDSKADFSELGECFRKLGGR